ncbi:MAG TPA: glycosyltransferase family 4 protein, partial [Vicinamibacterales bacterium]|nr:glycosyltransferase family 4 protein [Vicinamibacterales bacterium]
MTIVFLSPAGQLGGAEAALYEMLAGLRETHPSWSLRLVAASEGPLVSRVAALGIPVDVLPFPPALARLGDWNLGEGVRPKVVLLARCAAAALPTLVYLQRLRGALRAPLPAVVHTNGLKMHLLGAWARPRGAAVVWHFHDYAGRRALMAGLLRRTCHRCAAIVANSRSVAEDARSVCGTRVKVHPVWNAVDLTRFSPSGPRLDLDALAGLPPAGEGVLRVGLVATFARWKGHETFLRALALLPRSLHVRGYIVGGPIYETAGSQVTTADLRRQAEMLGVADRVGFTGFVQDSSAAIRALDLVVHASTDPEPFGLVIAEAMACGKAVIVSQAGGAIEFTEPGTNALTHPPGDAPALAARI